MSGTFLASAEPPRSRPLIVDRCDPAEDLRGTGVVGSGAPAFLTFFVFYLCCAAVTYGVYLRRYDAAVFAV